ncbi:MAG TPA: MFS transporter, partial [Ktedonobacteraceae bacterium]|nr:MFS transporter [Ktedonobacteraceae bacterium]
SLVSIGIFFSIITAGLAASLPVTLFSGLTQAGVPAAVADKIGHLPPTSALFAAFLGYNPMATLLPANVLHSLSAAKQANLLGHSFFPNLISPPFMTGLRNVFYLSAAMCLVAAVTSFLRGHNPVSVLADTEAVRQQEKATPEAERAALPADVD